MALTTTDSHLAICRRPLSYSGNNRTQRKHKDEQAARAWMLKRKQEGFAYYWLFGPAPHDGAIRPLIEEGDL